MAGSVVAQSNLVLRDQQGRYELGLHMALLADPQGEWTIEQVASSPLAVRFRASAEEVPILGFDNEVYWVRLELSNQSQLSAHWLLEIGWPNIQFVDLYQPRTDGSFELLRAGTLLPFDQRKLKHRLILFPLKLSINDPGEQQQLYLRFDTRTSLTLKLTLWQAQAFIEGQQASQYLLGVYYGLILVLLTFNILMLVTLRESSYAYYILFLLAFGLGSLVFDGLVSQYFWPLDHVFPMKLLLSFVHVAYLSMLLFGNAFLENKSRFPAMYWLVNGIFMLLLVPLIAGFWLGHGRYAIYLGASGVIIAVLMTVVGLSVWWRGFQPARLFFLGWLGMMAGNAIFIATHFGLLPSTTLTEISFRVGVCLLAAFLTAAQVDRIKLIVRQKIEVQDELARTLEQSKAELEKRVAERTHDLSAAKGKAEIANRAKSTFLSNMSHELRTPLNAVLGFTQILRMHEQNATNKKHLNAIQVAGESLLSMINDVLDLSKIEADKMELRPTPTSLKSICKEMNVLFGHPCEEKGIAFSFAIDETLPGSFLLDDVRIRQILLNLCSNAVKFTDQGGVSIRIEGKELDGDQTSRYRLVIAVQDSGKGVAVDQQEKIFQPFEQVDGQDVKQYGGTGLGLAIAQKTARLMGGQISLESEPDKGSCFTLMLPDIEVAVISAHQEEDTYLDTRAIEFAPASLIIADDIKSNREVLQGFLEAWDFDIQSVENGLQLVELAQRHPPDLILTDIKMPVMDGYQAISRLKADPNTANVPIITITASASEQDEADIRAVCEGYLRKPISRVELVGALSQFLAYQVSSEANIDDALQPENGELTAVELAALHEEEKEQLRQALIISDMEQARQICEQLETRQPQLALMIRNKLDNFAIQELLDLIECEY